MTHLSIRDGSSTHSCGRVTVRCIPVRSHSCGRVTVSVGSHSRCVRSVSYSRGVRSVSHGRGIASVCYSRGIACVSHCRSICSGIAVGDWCCRGGIGAVRSGVSVLEKWIR